jgi:hypothetical protein
MPAEPVACTKYCSSRCAACWLELSCRSAALLFGRFEGKALVWNVKVEIKAGDNSVTLDRRNGTLLEK